MADTQENEAKQAEDTITIKLPIPSDYRERVFEAYARQRGYQPMVPDPQAGMIENPQSFEEFFTEATARDLLTSMATYEAEAAAQKARERTLKSVKADVDKILNRGKAG